jgi:calcium-dependent protein kinase
MGNKPVTARKGGRDSSEVLHNNLIGEGSKLGEKYDLADSVMGTGKDGKATEIKRGQLKKYTKTEQNTGVAIKLYDGKSKSSDDLKTEARILSELDHPNIVKLFEVTKVHGKMSLVLELCDGGSILDRLPYKESQAASIVRQVCSAVSYMHRYVV